MRAYSAEITSNLSRSIKINLPWRDGLTTETTVEFMEPPMMSSQKPLQEWKPLARHESKGMTVSDLSSRASLTQGQQPQDSDDDSSDSLLDEVQETIVNKAWGSLRPDNDQILFGLRKTGVETSALHPEQVHIFKLWQIYLENVNPLLKVTHTPTLQGRIIDAASRVGSMDPSQAALMFSIYCMSISSLDDRECRAIFATPKEQLLIRYQLGCQQSLLNAGFLRSGSRDCLIALFLYLISVRPNTDSQSLSSLLSVAVRIAQRMGLDNSAAYAKFPPFEAEMGKRLWWSLVLFDTRVSELCALKPAMLTPAWDCEAPLSVNDFDLQPDMKQPPKVQGNSSEAIFAVVRSELADSLRHSAFHLDFTNPAMKAVAKDVQRGPVPEGGEMVTLEKTIEDKYLKFCSPESPLHFVTIWTARGFLAKNRLLEHYARASRLSVQQTDAQRDSAIAYGIDMLECDTRLMTSPLTKRYLWYIHTYFPFPAYIHIFQDLRKRPVCDIAERAWQAMSENYEARFVLLESNDPPIFNIFAKLVLQTWRSREAAFGRSEDPLAVPSIVLDVRKKVALMGQGEADLDTSGPDEGAMSISVDDDAAIPMPMDFGGDAMLYGIAGPGYGALGAYPTIHGQAAWSFSMNHPFWNAMNQNPIQGPAW